MDVKVSRRGKPAQERLVMAVMAGTPFDLDLIGGPGSITFEPWMVTELRRRETELRRFRHQIEERLGGSEARACASCGESVNGRADRRYCSGKCRQAGHRARVHNG
jgi:hypothetical protein